MIAINEKIKLKELNEKVSRKILGHGGSLMIAEVHFKKGGIGSAHSHDSHEQISYIVKGSFEVMLGEEKKVLKQGDSFYAAKNVIHEVVALEDGIILDIFTPMREELLSE
jgi:quercetin dioxygenase-like cupin family protein